jgi:hypothetical protein
MGRKKARRGVPSGGLHSRVPGEPPGPRFARPEGKLRETRDRGRDGPLALMLRSRASLASLRSLLRLGCDARRLEA